MRKKRPQPFLFWQNEPLSGSNDCAHSASKQGIYPGAPKPTHAVAGRSKCERPTDSCVLGGLHEKSITLG